MQHRRVLIEQRLHVDEVDGPASISQGVIRCQFIFSGKNDELTPDFPSGINLRQLRKLKDFKDSTYKNALVGKFSQIAELRQTLLRDLTGQVRKLRPSHRRSTRTAKLDEAEKVTELIRLHRKRNITREQFESYRDLLGLRPRQGKSKNDTSNPITGLFFDYGATVTASVNRDKPQEGWACVIEIVGENYETKKFEVIGIAVNSTFHTAEAAIRHGKKLVKSFTCRLQAEWAPLWETSGYHLSGCGADCSTTLGIKAVRRLDSRPLRDCRADQGRIDSLSGPGPMFR